MDLTVVGMTLNNEQILKWPPAAGTEVDTLISSLERQRRTFAWKCGDLDAAGLRATTAATTMLLKHLALVEADYFSVKLLGQDRSAVEHNRLGGRPGLGVAYGRRGHSRAALRALGGQRGPLPRQPHRGAGRRRPGPAHSAHLA